MWASLPPGAVATRSVAFRLARAVVTMDVGEIPPRELRSPMATTDLDLGRYQLGWSDAEDYIFKPKKGLNESIVREMSEMKDEPDVDEGLPPQGAQALRAQAHGLLVRGSHMPDLDFNDIYYYIKPTGGQVDDWDDLPDAIKNTYEKLGIPEAERKYLVRGHGPVRVRGGLPSQPGRPRRAGCAVLRHGHGGARVPRARPPLVRHAHPAQRQQVRRPELGGVVGRIVHLRAAGVKVEMPLQAYFRINAENMGQFERTLIIADEGSQVHYIEGCSAPVYTTDSLHSAVVELVALQGRASPIRPFRTGPPTSTTWSPSEPVPRPRHTSSGSTATLGRG